MIKCQDATAFERISCRNVGIVQVAKDYETNVVVLILDLSLVYAVYAFQG